MKEELVRNLRLLVAEERRQLEADLARKLEELDEMKRRHREEEARVQREIALLTEKMDSLEIPPMLLSTTGRRWGVHMGKDTLERDIKIPFKRTFPTSSFFGV